MKIRLTILKPLITLCCATATMAVFGQTTYTWTNSTPDGDLAAATNWSPNGVPNPTVGGFGSSTFDTIVFDGQSVGPVRATSSSGQTGASGGTSGFAFIMTANQVNPVTIWYPGSGASAGIRFQSIEIDAGAGQFNFSGYTNNSLGYTSAPPNELDTVWGGVNGQIHSLLNNSAFPAIINPNWRWRGGGGGAHTFDFGGTGDWWVTNSMISANNSATVFTKDGPGTLKWMYSPVLGQGGNFGPPFNINGGKVVLLSGNLLAGVTGTMNHNGDLIQYAAGADLQNPPQTSGTISMNINGTGAIEVDSGTLTLAGTSTYTGTNFLKGGELIAGSVETANPSGPLGEGGAGSISFQGGILGYSAFNGFDYSPRFDTSPGQQYKIDTASANVTYTNGLTSSGATLIKLGGGSLTLAGADTYAGLTTVSSGKLVLAGTASSGSITVADSAALGVVENATPFTPGTLTLGSSFGATFEANNVTNKFAAPLQPATLVSAGTTTINVNSGQFRLIGDTFPLLSWSSGTAPATILNFLSGAGGHLVTNGSAINLVIDQPPFLWTGGNNGTWDATTPNNWEFSGSPGTWVNSNYALFDDSLTANPSVTISGVVSGKTITFANVNTNYTLTSSSGNDLGGSSSLTMGGSGTTTLTGGANTYTGVTTITGGGILQVGTLANGGSPSDIGQSANTASNLVLNGGTLQYTGAGASIDRLFTLGTAGGIIDNEGGGTLAWNNPGSIGLSSSGSRNLILTGIGTADTLAAVVGDGGGPTSLTKNGAGTWILTGTNTYSGGTTVVAGELIVGAGGPGGTLGLGPVNDGTSIDINRTGTLTVGGVISETGSVTSDGSGTVILANNNTYRGGTTINAGTLQVGNGGGTGSLYNQGPIVDNSLVAFDTTGSFVYLGNGLISGPGNVIVQGGGFQKFIGANTYTGWTRIDSGSIFQPCEGNTGGLASSVVTNNGVLRLVRQDNGVFSYSGNIVGSGSVQVGANNGNAGDVTLTGSNSYTGGTFIGDNAVILGDNANPGSGAFLGNVTFTNNWQTGDDNPRTLNLNRVDNFTLGGNIVTNFATSQNNRGIVQLSGSAIVTLTGNNTYGSGTVVSNGSLAIGNGGSTGSVGVGPVTFANPSSANNGLPFVINRSGTLAIPGAITTVSGNGALNLLAYGGVTLILGGANNYTGSTTISNASEFINGSDTSASIYVTNGMFGGVGTIAGPVTLDTGTTLYAASTPSPGNLGTLTINNNLTLGGSNFVFEVNRSVSPSNSLVAVSGTLAGSGPGFLLITNTGPNLHTGDRFVLFNQPLPNGALINVSGGRATWINNLAVDGSISVGTVAQPPTLNIANLGNGSLRFSWSDSTSLFKLQWQTNSLRVGLSNNWKDYPGSTANTNTLTVPASGPIMGTNNQAEFFRIISVP